MGGQGFSSNQNASGIITVTNVGIAYDSVQGVFTFPRTIKGYLLYANEASAAAAFFRVGLSTLGIAAGTNCIQIPQPGFISADMLTLASGTSIFFGHSGGVGVSVKFSIMFW
jgi:hypothetical protein